MLIQSINPEKATTFTSSANYYPWKSNNFHLYQKDMMGERVGNHGAIVKRSANVEAMYHPLVCCKGKTPFY